MSSNAKTAIIASVAALLAVAGYSQVDRYIDKRAADQAQQDAIREQVAEHTAAVKALLELEQRPSSMTYAELFDTVDERVKKLGETLIPVETSSYEPETKAALKSYLQGLQETARLQVATYRKSLASRSSQEFLTSSVKELQRSTDNEYSFRFARQRAEDALEEAKKSRDELSEAQKAFIAHLSMFRGSLTKLRPQIAQHSVLEDAFLAEVLGDKPETPNLVEKAPGKKA